MSTQTAAGNDKAFSDLASGISGKSLATRVRQMLTNCLPAVQALQKELFSAFFLDVANLTPYMYGLCDVPLAELSRQQWLHAAAEHFVVA